MSLLAAVLLASALSPPTSPALAGPLTEERLSLEELRERYKQKREALLSSFRKEIKDIVAKIESDYERGARSYMDRHRNHLIALGPEATPLLVQQIDPGSSATAAQMGRADQVARVLTEISTRNISTELILIFETGSERGQHNALRALAASDDPERVGPVLRGHFGTADASVRASLIAAIATLGGPKNYEFIGDVLSNPDEKIVETALEALADNRCVAAGPKILELVHATLAAAPHVKDIVAYYRACPEVVDDEHCTELVLFAKALKNNPAMSERVLLLLSEFEDEWGSKIKKHLKELTTSSSSRISEAASICLARAGDRTVKKKLLEPFDMAIERNDRIASSWQKRAEIKMRVGDYKSAIKDFIKAQQLSAGYQRSLPEIYIGVARCYAKLRKFKEAAKWLDQGGLNISQLHVLSRDPDFAPLLEDHNLRKVFRLDS